MRRARRVLGYARVSSAEQALGSSLDDQQALIRAHAQKGGLNVERMYVEAESAIHEKIERREQIRALLADARAGDLVLVDKVDRWSRDPEFTYRSMRELRERGVSVYFIGDACDPSTPEGDTMLGMRALFAREEHKRIRVRTVGTRKLLRDRGYYVEGLPPWGYRRQGVKGLERNVLVADEAEADRVREAFRRCVGGETIDQIAQRLEEARDRVARALRSRVYLGEVRDSRGVWIAGKHPALVDPRLFSAAGDALDCRRLGERGSREDAATASWWLRTVARCALCGSRMSAAYGGGSKESGRYYFCCAQRCTRLYVPVRVAEAACELLVLERLTELREQLTSPPERAARAKPPIDLDARRTRLALKRERYLEQHADGLITSEQLRERLARLDAERTRVDAEAFVPAPPPPEQRRAALREVRALQRAWRDALPAERRSIVVALARSVRLAVGQPPRFDWYSAEDLSARA